MVLVNCLFDCWSVWNLFTLMLSIEEVLLFLVQDNRKEGKADVSLLVYFIVVG